MLPRVFAIFADALAMMSFGALIQPIARVRQAGALGAADAWA